METVIIFKADKFFKYTLQVMIFKTYMEKLYVYFKNVLTHAYQHKNLYKYV